MKRSALIIIFLIVCKILIYSQEEKQKKFIVYVGSGLVQLTTTDPLINYYNYAGNATMPFILSGSYIKNKNLFTLNLLYTTTKLNPIHLTDNDYVYNNIQQQDVEFSFEYFREINEINKYMQAYIGIGNSSYLAMQKESYKSLLYDYAEGYRKSYDVSAISLSPMLFVNFKLKKNSLIIKTGFSLLHYATRPDDNYVKQIGLPESFHWILYGPKKFKSIFFSAVYQFEIIQRFGVTASYNILYRTYSAPNNYKYLRNSYLLGIFKSF